MNEPGTVRRGLRVGLLMACVPGLPWAALALAVAAVEWLRGGDLQLAARDVRYGLTLAGGSVSAGLLMGLVLAGGLTLASRVSSRGWVPALAGALLGASVFPAEVLVVALGTDVAYLPVGLTLLAWPVLTVVAAAHSADVAGRTRSRTWLWTPGPVGRLRWGAHR